MVVCAAYTCGSTTVATSPSITPSTTMIAETSTNLVCCVLVSRVREGGGGGRYPGGGRN